MNLSQWRKLKDFLAIQALVYVDVAKGKESYIRVLSGCINKI